MLQVTAKGSPDVPLSWAYDLQMGLTRLFGALCGATLASNPGLCSKRNSHESTSRTEDDLKVPLRFYSSGVQVERKTD